MQATTKKRIRIDRERCTGCGKCVLACPGGALDMVDGKADVVREDYCDGLGACLGECPADAIRWEEVPAEEETAHAGPEVAPSATMHAAHSSHVESRATVRETDPSGAHDHGGADHACPHVRPWSRDVSSSAPARDAGTPSAEKGERASTLANWPIQLPLINPQTPAFAGADLLIAADCTAFSHASFHETLLAGRRLVMVCPKLERNPGMQEKLTALLAAAKPRSITVARMEVPCCGSLTRWVAAACAEAGCEAPVREVVLRTEGGVREEAPVEVGPQSTACEGEGSAEVAQK